MQGKNQDKKEKGIHGVEPCLLGHWCPLLLLTKELSGLKNPLEVQLRKKSALLHRESLKTAANPRPRWAWEERGASTGASK